MVKKVNRIIHYQPQNNAANHNRVHIQWDTAVPHDPENANDVNYILLLTVRIISERNNQLLNKAWETFSRKEKLYDYLAIIYSKCNGSL